MKPIKIGNWLIDYDGINWEGVPSTNYFISKKTLTQSRGNEYDWLLHMSEKPWLTKEDIYALNTAFIYAMEAYGISYPSELSFVDTFTYQEEIIKRKKMISFKRGLEK